MACRGSSRLAAAGLLLVGLALLSGATAQTQTLSQWQAAQQRMLTRPVPRRTAANVLPTNPCRNTLRFDLRGLSGSIISDGGRQLLSWTGSVSMRTTRSAVTDLLAAPNAGCELNTGMTCNIFLNRVLAPEYESVYDIVIADPASRATVDMTREFENFGDPASSATLACVVDDTRGTADSLGIFTHTIFAPSPPPSPPPPPPPPREPTGFSLARPPTLNILPADGTIPLAWTASDAVLTPLPDPSRPEQEPFPFSGVSIGAVPEPGPDYYGVFAERIDCPVGVLTRSIRPSTAPELELVGQRRLAGGGSDSDSDSDGGGGRGVVFQNMADYIYNYRPPGELFTGAPEGDCYTLTLYWGGPTNVRANVQVSAPFQP